MNGGNELAILRSTKWYSSTMNGFYVIFAKINDFWHHVEFWQDFLPCHELKPNSTVWDAEVDADVNENKDDDNYESAPEDTNNARAGKGGDSDSDFE